MFAIQPDEKLMQLLAWSHLRVVKLRGFAESIDWPQLVLQLALRVMNLP